MIQARQGDLYFDKVASLPSTVKPSGSPILAYGEVTGHCHRVREGQDFVKTFVDTNGDIWMSSDRSFDLDHDEHGTLTMEPGTYKMTRQREYDADEREKERRVRD